MDAFGAADPADSNDEAELRPLAQRSVIDFDGVDRREKDPKAMNLNSRRNRMEKTVPLPTTHGVKKKRLLKGWTKSRKDPIVGLMNFCNRAIRGIPKMTKIVLELNEGECEGKWRY
jgi:hypothetical protein